MVISTNRNWDRTAERRQGLSRFLVQALDGANSANGLGARRERLEVAIRRVLGATSATIREGIPKVRNGDARDEGGNVRIALPGTVNPPMHLEVRVDRSRGFDSWARQTIMDVARISTLALALDIVPGRPRAKDEWSGAGASSLQFVGSSPRMVRLRHEISRVARTDFTVLVEGATGP